MLDPYILDLYITVIQNMMVFPVIDIAFFNILVATRLYRVKIASLFFHKGCFGGVQLIAKHLP